MHQKQQEYERIAELIMKSIENHDKPNDELIQILSKNKHSDELIKNIASRENFANKNRMINTAYSNRRVNDLLQKIDKRTDCKRKSRQLKITTVISTSIAATLMAVTLLVYNFRQPETETIATLTEVNPKHLTPTLIVGEKIIALKSSKTDVTSYKENITSTPLLKRIVVPTGTTHVVVLEDGSEVTLNASSELTYSSFDSKEQREVLLTGEAYFNIKKSEKPFIVKVEDCSVKVYGTEFNINAYNRNRIKTVLVSGSVGISGKGICEAKITPNQIIEIDLTTGSQHVEEIDVSPYISWLKGDLEFIDEDFNTILMELTRWYDIDFEYNREHFKNCKISFIINRQKPLDKVIELIENLTKVKFTKEEKKGGIYKIEKY